MLLSLSFCEKMNLLCRTKPVWHPLLPIILIVSIIVPDWDHTPSINFLPAYIGSSANQWKTTTFSVLTVLQTILSHCLKYIIAGFNLEWKDIQIILLRMPTEWIIDTRHPDALSKQLPYTDYFSIYNSNKIKWEVQNNMTTNSQPDIQIDNLYMTLLAVVLLAGFICGVFWTWKQRFCRHFNLVSYIFRLWRYENWGNKTDKTDVEKGYEGSNANEKRDVRVPDLEKGSSEGSRIIRENEKTQEESNTHNLIVEKEDGKRTRIEKPKHERKKKDETEQLKIKEKEKLQKERKEKEYEAFYRHVRGVLERGDQISDIPKGLPNLGNTCYMNSILQVLSWTPLLGSQLAHHLLISKERNTPHVDIPENAVRRLFHLLEEVHGEKENCLSENIPGRILAEARRLNNQFNGYRQQDSFEMFNTLIGGLEEEVEEDIRQNEELGNTNATQALMTISPVSRLLGGMFVTIWHYESCQHVELTFQRFTSLSVPLPRVHTEVKQEQSKCLGTEEDREGKSRPSDRCDKSDDVEQDPKRSSHVQNNENSSPNTKRKKKQKRSSSKKKKLNITNKDADVLKQPNVKIASVKQGEDDILKTQEKTFIGTDAGQNTDASQLSKHTLSDENYIGIKDPSAGIGMQSSKQKGKENIDGQCYDGKNTDATSISTDTLSLDKNSTVIQDPSNDLLSSEQHDDLNKSKAKESVNEQSNEGQNTDASPICKDTLPDENDSGIKDQSVVLLSSEQHDDIDKSKAKEIVNGQSNEGQDTDTLSICEDILPDENDSGIKDPSVDLLSSEQHDDFNKSKAKESVNEQSNEGQDTDAPPILKDTPSENNAGVKDPSGETSKVSSKQKGGEIINGQSSEGQDTDAQTISKDTLSLENSRDIEDPLVKMDILSSKQHDGLDISKRGESVNGRANAVQYSDAQLIHKGHSSEYSRDNSDSQVVRYLPTSEQHGNHISKTEASVYGSLNERQYRDASLICTKTVCKGKGSDMTECALKMPLSADQGINGMHKSKGGENTGRRSDEEQEKRMPVICKDTQPEEKCTDITEQHIVMTVQNFRDVKGFGQDNKSESSNELYHPDESSYRVQATHRDQTKNVTPAVENRTDEKNTQVIHKTGNSKDLSNKWQTTDMTTTPRQTQAGENNEVTPTFEERNAKDPDVGYTSDVSATDIIEHRPLEELRMNCTDLERGIKELTDEEIWDESIIGCRKCCPRDISGKITRKKLLIISLPPVLVVHINKIEKDGYGGLRKIEKNVGYPKYLNMAPFCSSAMQLEVLGGKGSKGDTRATYSLYGVVSHVGSIHGGHYTAYVKTKPRNPRELRDNFMKTTWTDPEKVSSEMEDFWRKQQPKSRSQTPVANESLKETWFHISDSFVALSTDEEATNDRNAYILMYERFCGDI